MQHDLQTRETPTWQVTGERADRDREGRWGLVLGKGQTLKVMDHKDAATSHKSAQDNGRPEQRVYRSGGVVRRWR